MSFYNINLLSLTIHLALKICLSEVALGAIIKCLLNDSYNLKFVCMLLFEGYNDYGRLCHLFFFQGHCFSPHAFLCGLAVSICCTSLPSSCLSLLNIQGNSSQANLAYFISRCGLAVNYFEDEY